MEEFPLISDSYGTGDYGDYLVEIRERLNVVIDHFLFATLPGASKDESVHLQIARQGMDELNKGIKKDFYKRKKDAKHSGGYELSSCFQISYDIRKATSTLTDADEFVRVYTHVFLNPPYGLRFESGFGGRRICSQTIAKLFGDLSGFTIRRWSSDWPPYFDAGNEWGGAYLWTLVSDDGRGWWVGSSATD